MVLGALVILIVGVLVVNYVRDNKGFLPGWGGSEVTQGETKTHTVSLGEDLWKISETYYGTGYGWVDIAEVNNISSPDLIEVGQTLTIPERQIEQSTSEEPETIAGTTSIQGDTYTVIKGDHLWGIAVRAYGDGYKWVEIANANNLKNPNILFVDTVLTLPR